MGNNKQVVFLLLFIGLALSCPDFCNDCDDSGKVCFACKQDYELSVLGKCVSNIIDKCIVYGPTNQCFVCQPSFELSNNKCVKQYNGCLRKNTMDNQCYECGFGRALDANVCKGTLNCANPDLICETCAEGFELKSDGRCYDKSEGCAVQGGQEGVCKECKTGYKLVGYRCIKQQVFVPYCYIYYNDSSCQICKNGYSFFQNYCLLPTHIQAILSGQTTIEATISQIKKEMGMTMGGSKTQTSTSTNGGKTTTTTTTTTVIVVQGNIANCAKLNGNVCISCNAGYVVASGQCNAMDPNCAAYELATGKCQSCISSFEFAQNGTCVPKQVVAKIDNCQVIDPSNSRFCLICAERYYQNGLGGCAKVSRLCNNYNPQNGFCTSCLFGLQLNSGRCVDNGCAGYGPDDFCTSCGSGYKLSTVNGICEYSDPNCATFVNGRCDNCVTGFYPNTKGQCWKLIPNCLYGNVIQQNQCVQCANGFLLQSNGQCQAQQITVTIANCAIVQNNQCQQCVTGFYVKNNACVKISGLCTSYNATTGVCFGCVNGYTLISGNCFDLNCINQVEDKCLQCKNTYWVAPGLNLCVINDPNCLSPSANPCTNCASGFAVGQSGLCEKIVTPVIPTTPVVVPTTPTTPTVTPTTPSGVNEANRDPNCVNYQNGKCLQCSNRYYMSDNKCIPVNQNCKDYQLSNGLCTSCYPGYMVSNGNCIPSLQSDPYCKSRNAMTNACIECFQSYWLNGTKCQQVNPLCQTSNLTNGQCLSCWPSYSLLNGQCLQFSKDPNCREYNNASQCTKCAVRYYYDSGMAKCMPVNILCQDFNQITGACLTCYTGYKLSNGLCVEGTAANTDVNCKTTSQSGLCVECYSSFFVKNGKCQKLNVLCQSSNTQTGACLSCYTGYRLSNGDCIPGQVNDPNCKEYSDPSTKKVCKTCYDGFYPRFGICTGFNPLCKISNSQTGACLDCYPGYSLASNGQCVLSTSVQAQTTEPYCKDWNGARCAKCVTGYFLNPTNASCILIDPLCKTINQSTGDCIQCYVGYSLSGKTCVIAQVVQITFCTKTDSSGTVCLECLDNYFVKNNACLPVSGLCGGRYDKISGKCTGCVDGYFLQDGDCIQPAMGWDPACEHYANAFCDKCSTGFSLVQYRCAKV